MDKTTLIEQGYIFLEPKENGIQPIEIESEYTGGIAVEKLEKRYGSKAGEPNA